MAKQPWFPWYADDWLSDEKLRACSPAARGLWTDILCLMHKNDRRGYLQIGGNPVTPAQLARMTGCTPDEASHLLAELLHAGVPSVSDHGLIYSRRMTRDEKIRQARSSAGQASGRKRAQGSQTPQSGGSDDPQEVRTNQRTKREQNANKPSTSEPESETEKNKDPPNPPKGAKEVPLPFDSEAFKAAWEEWLTYKRQRRDKPYTPIGLRNLFKQVSEMGEAAAIAAIRKSIANGYQGFAFSNGASGNGRPSAQDEIERLAREHHAG